MHKQLDLFSEPSRLSVALEDQGRPITMLTDQEITALMARTGVPEIVLQGYIRAKRFGQIPKTDDVEEMREALIVRSGGDIKILNGKGDYSMISELSGDIVQQAYKNHRRADPQTIHSVERRYRL
jgi:hypothetical protein